MTDTDPREPQPIGAEQWPAQAVPVLIVSPTPTFICPVCGFESPFRHDHKPDNTGLDDGPHLHAPRKKAASKPAEVMADIRARAWATRREKYGKYGHR